MRYNSYMKIFLNTYDLNYMYYLTVSNKYNFSIIDRYLFTFNGTKIKVILGDDL